MFETFFGAAQYGLPFVVAFVVALALIAVTAWLVRRAGSYREGTETSRGRQRRLARHRCRVGRRTPATRLGPAR